MGPLAKPLCWGDLSKFFWSPSLKVQIPFTSYQILFETINYQPRFPGDADSGGDTPTILSADP